MATGILMYDGVSSLAAGIARAFPGAAKVAGYADGTYAWSQAEWDLFPHADHVKIAVRASANAGDVLDVERGDATPQQAAGWIRMRHAAGLYRPTVYCSLSVVPDVRAATGSLILGRDYDIWVAKYDRSPAEPPVPGLPPARFAAKQYESDAAWDISVVYDPGWPHRTPPVTALPPPPEGLSSKLLGVDLSWRQMPGVTHYRYQVAQGAPARPGAEAATGVVAWTPVVHVPELRGAGPWCWRVQAGGNGRWSDWTAVG